MWLIQKDKISANAYGTILPLLLTISAGFLFFRLGTWGVIETSEARYAEISLAMSHNGDLLHPELLNIYHFHKPPITYWITSLAFDIFGANAFSTRFFLQIALLVQIALVYKIGVLLFKNERIALYAAVIYLSFPLVVISSRALTTDIYLNTFCLLTVYFWMVYKRDSKEYFLYLFYLMIGLGFLTKGPLIFIILPVVIAYSCYQPKSAINRVHKVLAPLLGILICLSWYVILITEDHRFLHYFLYEHTYKRLFDPTYFNRSQPFWFYLVIIPATTFPWILILIELIAKKGKEILRQEKWVVLLIWILPPLVLFSVSSSKLALYVLPIYPGIALAAAWSTTHLSSRSLNKWHIAQFTFHVLMVLGLISLGWTSQFIISNQLIYFYIITFLVLVLVHFYRRVNLIEKMMLSGLVFIGALTVSSTYILSSNPSQINSSNLVTDYLKITDLYKRQIVVYNRLTPSISFNLDKPIVSISDGSLTRETLFQKNLNWTDYLMNLNSNEDSIRLRNQLGSNSVLLAKSGLPLERQWLADSLKHQHQTGKWTIYY